MASTPKEDPNMAWTAIQKRHFAKHLQNIHNIKAYTLDNGFSGAPCAALGDHALAHGKMSIDKAAGHGKLRLHSNCWYLFDYSPATPK
jgi:hypothetical protein